jgi:drug/metabolite transporter (DMT)-like permease
MQAQQVMEVRDWSLLVLLSILWGGSFVFAGIAVKELPPLTIVLVRVALAALILLPVAWAMGVKLPTSIAGWWPFLVMGVLNNVIPFSLIVSVQQWITSGLASVLNATTPLFTVLVMAAAGQEALIARRVAGVLIGVAGVAALRGQAGLGAEPLQLAGMALCLAACLSYGLAGLWGRLKLLGAPPLTSATCQLVSSSLIMAVVAGVIERPWTPTPPSLPTWLALIGFAALSTALAYIVFFQILVRSGATNVMLVTLLIPVSAITLGVLVLGEPVRGHEILGALVIAAALLVIDGRTFALWQARS